MVTASLPRGLLGGEPNEYGTNNNDDCQYEKVRLGFTPQESPIPPFTALLVSHARYSNSRRCASRLLGQTLDFCGRPLVLRQSLTALVVMKLFFSRDISWPEIFYGPALTVASVWLLCFLGARLAHRLRRR